MTSFSGTSGSAELPDSLHGEDPEGASSSSTSISNPSDLDREIAEAMSGMSDKDLAELSGGVEGLDSSAGPIDSYAGGTEVTAAIVAITDDDVYVQFDAKSQGIIPRSQFGKKEILTVGRRVDVVVDGFDVEGGIYQVSRKGATQRATWTNLKRGMIIEGRVTGVIKGGLEMDIKGIRAFMPGSQADLYPMKDVSLLLNQVVRCEVLELDRRNKNILVSRRKLMEREQVEAREKLKGELEVGQTRKGTVSRIADFGAFVDLGGIDGLIHISDLSWGTVDKVADVLTPGQEVEVRVLKIDTTRDRISLGLKQALPDPWTGVAARFPVGTNVKARIVRIVDFGAFAELEPGIDGLIPLSELGWTRVRAVSDVVSVGDIVDVVVLRVESAKRRIALSTKQAQPDPWATVLESFTPQSLVTGRISRLADFGAFIELTPGVEGLIHISELSDRRVKSCGEVVQVGQEVQTRVLGVDKENRRISLSIKAVAASQKEVHSEAMVTAESKPSKHRKKPLRGGLSSHFEW